MMILWSVITLVALVAYIFFVMRIQNSIAKVAELATEVAHQSERDVRLGSVESVIRETVTERGELHKHFLVEDDIVDFITGIEELGVRAGITTNVISVSESFPEEVGSGGTLDLRLELDGTWSGIAQTLVLLETQEIATIVKEMSLKADSSAASLWAASVTLEAQMFKYEE